MVAASLAYLVLRQRDTVGLVTFDEKIRHFVPPSSHPSHRNIILHALNTLVPRARSSHGPVFHEMAERIKNKGLVIVISDLFDEPATILSGLDLQARSVVEGYVSGLHKSPYHGFSVEFAEHREYVPGDDIRHVDWKAWSKTDKLYLKQYEEETNLLAYLLLDTSESMGYASDRNVTKLEYAKFIAAALGYLVLQQQDSVGLATFDEKVQRYLRPSGQPSHLKELFQLMDISPAGSKSDVGAIFNDLAERFRKRGVVIVLSDLFDEPSRVLAGLRHFRHRRHEVIVFHVLDPAELEFPFRQTTLFKGLEGLGDVLAEPHALRRAYPAEINRFCDEVRKGCQVSNIDYLLLKTDQPLDRALSTFLASRMVRVK
jgi:uncharacterized protein (DUF58 family)